jgi:hypothetical protein
MQVSEIFSRTVRTFALIVAICVFAVFVVTWLDTSARVEAQNAGTVGIYALSTPAFFPAKTSNGCSATFKDNGQGQNTLFFVTANFTGTIDLEWKPQGQSTYYTITQASYSADTSNSHTLQFGGYFPNIRACISNISGGSLAAWYNATSGPVPTALSGLGTNGPTSPIICDHDAVSGTIANTATGSLLISPINTGDQIVICSFTVSFNGATAAGTWQIGFWFNGSCGGGGGSPQITELTTASTPQTLPIPMILKASNPVFEFPCLTNNSGASMVVSASFASVHGT